MVVFAHSTRLFSFLRAPMGHIDFELPSHPMQKSSGDSLLSPAAAEHAPLSSPPEEAKPPKSSSSAAMPAAVSA